MITILKDIKKIFREREEIRSRTFTLSRSILKSSKKIISRLHYDDITEAHKIQDQCFKDLSDLQKLISKNKKIKYDGHVREGLEEFIEANLYHNFIQRNKITIDKKILSFIGDDPDTIIGGLCDFTGELVRRAVRVAVKEKMHDIQNMSETTNKIIETLLDMDLTGYSRTKFDAAKRNAQKLEMILYDLRIRS